MAWASMLDVALRTAFWIVAVTTGESAMVSTFPDRRLSCAHLFLKSRVQKQEPDEDGCPLRRRIRDSSRRQVGRDVAQRVRLVSRAVIEVNGYVLVEFAGNRRFREPELHTL